MRYLALASVLLLTGCGIVARDAGYAGAHPGYFYCKGKGVITATGALAIGAGAGGGQANNLSLMADCSPDGFTFQQGMPPAPGSEPAAPAK